MRVPLLYTLGMEMDSEVMLELDRQDLVLRSLAE